MTDPSADDEELARLLRAAPRGLEPERADRLRDRVFSFIDDEQAGDDIDHTPLGGRPGDRPPAESAVPLADEIEFELPGDPIDPERRQRIRSRVFAFVDDDRLALLLQQLDHRLEPDREQRIRDRVFAEVDDDLLGALIRSADVALEPDRARRIRARVDEELDRPVSVEPLVAPGVLNEPATPVVVAATHDSGARIVAPAATPAAVRSADLDHAAEPDAAVRVIELELERARRRPRTRVLLGAAAAIVTVALIGTALGARTRGADEIGVAAPTTVTESITATPTTLAVRPDFEVPGSLTPSREAPAAVRSLAEVAGRGQDHELDAALTTSAQVESLSYPSSGNAAPGTASYLRMLRARDGSGVRELGSAPAVPSLTVPQVSDPKPQFLTTADPEAEVAFAGTTYDRLRGTEATSVAVGSLLSETLDDGATTRSFGGAITNLLAHPNTTPSVRAAAITWLGEVGFEAGTVLRIDGRDLATLVYRQADRSVVILIDPATGSGVGAAEFPGDPGPDLSQATNWFLVVNASVVSSDPS